MRREVGTKWRCSALFFALAVGGCAASMRTSVAPRRIGADLTTFRPAAAGGPSPRAVDVPTGDMTLDRALGVSFEYSPTLESQAWEAASHDGLVERAALVPDPEFFADVENGAGSGDFRSPDSAEATSNRLVGRVVLEFAAPGGSQGTPPREGP